WTFRTLRWWNLGDLQTHLKRKMRQAQGVLENMAIREHLARQRKPPQALPETVSELVNCWIAAHRSAALRTFVKTPLTLIAARRLQNARYDRSQTVTPPLLIAQAQTTRTNAGK